MTRFPIRMAREHQRHIQKKEPGNLLTSDKKKTKQSLEMGR